MFWSRLFSGLKRDLSVDVGLYSTPMITGVGSRGALCLFQDIHRGFLFHLSSEPLAPAVWHSAGPELKHGCNDRCHVSRWGVVDSLWRQWRPPCAANWKGGRGRVLMKHEMVTVGSDGLNRMIAPAPSLSLADKNCLLYSLTFSLPGPLSFSCSSIRWEYCSQISSLNALQSFAAIISPLSFLLSLCDVWF